MKCLKCNKIISGTTKYGLHERCFVNWFKTDSKNEFISLKQRSAQSTDSKINESYSNTSFYHGKFKKYSADLGGENYIFKMRESTEAPELPEVEYLCNQIARTLSLPVPEFYYIDFLSEKLFVTKVFIKKSSGTSNLEHIYKFRPDEAYQEMVNDL